MASLTLGLQGPLSQLIYRFLASGAGSAEADRKTRLLLALVQDIHMSAYIMQHRTRNMQTTVTFPTGHCPSDGLKQADKNSYLSKYI